VFKILSNILNILFLLFSSAVALGSCPVVGFHGRGVHEKLGLECLIL
jgi:hypothetical protein